MAHKIIWSVAALRQFKEITDFISIDSDSHAANVATRIVAAVDNLELFPLMRRRVPEFNRDDYREILVMRWRIIYRVSDYDIDIAEIVHGAQRWRG